MVVVKLMGGMGNQMFQYAVGRSLAERLGAELLFDHSFLETDPGGRYTQRKFELDVFTVHCGRADEMLLKKIGKMRKKHTFTRLAALITGKNIFTIVTESGFPFHSGIETLRGNIYLDGFWQSEKYFISIRDQLLKDFRLSKNLSVQAEEMKTRILSDERSVSVHFRRGDYITNSETHSFHGVKGTDYYLGAMERMKKEVTDCKFYFFSDDIDWVEQNVQVPGAIYIKGLESYEDLELMKNCRHNITANSSFSWWAAWLNEHPDKMIIAPLQWFADTSVNTKDLIPNAWIKI